MKLIMNMLLIALVAAFTSATVPAQDVGAVPGLVAKPTSLTIPAGGMGTVVLQSKIMKPQTWKLVLPLPTCVAVTPSGGPIPANGDTKVSIKAIGKAGERGVVGFMNDLGDKLSVTVTIGPASDAGVVPKWNLLPSEGSSSGKPVGIQIKNEGTEQMKWRVGHLPKGVTVAPMNGIIPPLASTPVNITLSADAGSAGQVLQIPFISGGVTKNFAMTIQSSPGGQPGDLQSR
ncbi:MAG: hypothetical protein IPP94_18435 [Ignavibacteria bacterium]|nr:hypothetical protein [Ignavibacteria bacterium]